MRLKDKQNLALVLSGGGGKAAAFHVGVCLALRNLGFKFAGGTKKEVAEQYPDNHMTFKQYVGSSAGALISTILANGYSVESLIAAFLANSKTNEMVQKKYQARAKKKLRSLSYFDVFSPNLSAGHISRFLPNLFKKKPLIHGGLEVLLKRGFKINGIFTTKNLEKYLRTHVCDTNQFKDLGVDLSIVATQLNHCRKVIFNAHRDEDTAYDCAYRTFANISEATAASASLPPAFAPYSIKDYKGNDIYFFDGEIRDTLSTHVAVENKADLVICSYSLQPYHYHKEMGSIHEYGIPMICNQALYQLTQQKIQKTRDDHKQIKALIEQLRMKLKSAGLDEKTIEETVEMIQEKTQHNSNVEYVYIHPSPHDYQMFFYDHFSLNEKILEEIIKVGYRSTMNKMKERTL